MDRTRSSREAILGAVRAAIAAHAADPLPPLPEAARFAPRQAARPEQECAALLSEVKRLSGQALRIQGRDDFDAALARLVESEQIRTAACSDDPLYATYPLAERLAGLGVRIVAANADRQVLADCDLGITVADAALPETGTVLLRTTQGQPNLLSLLPRVHLALVTPRQLVADLHQAFAIAKGDRHFVFVSGSSRTADIEKKLTLGVHGPKSFHVWICDKAAPAPPSGSALTTAPAAD